MLTTATPPATEDIGDSPVLRPKPYAPGRPFAPGRCAKASSAIANFSTVRRRSKLPTAWDREIPFWYVPFDVLRAFDLPDLLAASPAAGTVLHPIDGDWNRMSPAAALRLLPRKVAVVEAEEALVDRLLKKGAGSSESVRAR